MRYTAVFEFQTAPKIKKSDSWLGGQLCIINFSDALAELDQLKAKMNKIEDWYKYDGSVGGLSHIIDTDEF